MNKNSIIRIIVLRAYNRHKFRDIESIDYKG